MRLLILSLAISSLSGCSGSSTPTLAPNVTAQQQASAGKSMRLTFPPQTRFLLYHRDSEDGLPGPDDAVHVKIELPASALADFLAQQPLESAKWAGEASLIRDVSDWPQWQPSKVQKLRCEQFELPNAEALEVLIDDDQSDPSTIYLFWCET